MGRSSKHTWKPEQERGGRLKKKKQNQNAKKKKKAVNKSRGVKKKKRITRIFDNKDGMEQPYLSCYAPREGSEDEQ